MKRLPHLLLSLLILALSPALFALTPSNNVWHIPFNKEVPFEDGTPDQLQMRFPYVEVAPGATVVVYQGFDKDGGDNGNQTGGKVWFRDVTADGEWDSVDLGFHQGDDTKQFWKGIIDLSAEGIPALNIVEYYIEVNFDDSGADPDTTYLSGDDLEPSSGGEFLATTVESEAQADAYSIRDRPAYIFHAGDRIVQGNGVTFFAKVGYIGFVDSLFTRWADNGVVYYTTDGTDPDGTLGVGAGTTQVVTFEYTNPEQNEIDEGSSTGARAMIWQANASNLLNGVAFGSMIKYKIGFWNSTNLDEKFADHNAGPENSIFSFQNGAPGDPRLTVESESTGSLDANYTTSKLFLDEIAGSNETLDITFEPGEAATEVEVVTNMNRRDFVNSDENSNGRPDGMEFNQTEDIIGDGSNPASSDDYYLAYNMTLNTPGVYTVSLPVEKTGAYRLTARWKVDGDPDWRWYTNTTANRRDHAVTISPVDARDLRIYEINTLTIEAKATGTFIERSTFEDLHDAPGAPRTVDGRGFNLEYLQGLGVNWLWFQPIHPPAVDGRETDPATGSAYEPGSPYAVKNFFEVNPWMSADYDGSESGGINGATARAEAMASFQGFAAAADTESVQIMLDAPFNHTAFDVEFGPYAYLFERFGDTLAPETEIRYYETRFFSRENNYGERATLNSGEGPAEAPDRGDFGKWNDVKDVYFGFYDALVPLNPQDNGQYLSDGDRFRYAAVGQGTPENPESSTWNSDDFYQGVGNTDPKNVTRQVWKYFAAYGPYWLEKTRPTGENMNSADWIELGNSLTAEQRYTWDARGIDGLRCDFGQGLPPQTWEYIINVARSYKWNLVMMSESLDGGSVTYRSNRHFDILNENIVFPLKVAGNAQDYRSIFDNRRNAYGQGLVLLNNTSHDEENFENIWFALMRYNVASTVDGAPMVFMGQELGVTRTSGFTFYETNFGKNIAHFKKFNSMQPGWENRAASPFGEEFIFDAFGAVGQARAFSPALRSANRFYLNRKADGTSRNEIWSVAKYETPGGSPAFNDVVFAFANLRTDAVSIDAFDVDIDSGGTNLFGIKPDRRYNVKNIAAYTKIDGTRRDTWLWDDPETPGFEYRTGQNIFDAGISVTLNDLPANSEEWDTEPYETQFLKLYDVTPPPAPTQPANSTGESYVLSETVTFIWNASPSNTADDVISSYKLVIKKVGTNETVFDQNVGDVTSYDYTGTYGDELYAFVIPVSDAGIEGTASTSSNSVELFDPATPPGVPSQPAIVSSTLGRGIYSGPGYAIGNGISISWNAPASSSSYDNVASYRLVIKRVGTDETVFDQNVGNVTSYDYTGSFGDEFYAFVIAVSPASIEGTASTSSSSVELFDPAGDEDGDGVSNYDEAGSGTDPFDRNSLLEITQSSLNASDQFTLSWFGVDGIYYGVASKTDLTQEFWYQESSTIIGTGATINWTDTSLNINTTPEKFYRVRGSYSR